MIFFEPQSLHHLFHGRGALRGIGIAGIGVTLRYSVKGEQELVGHTVLFLMAANALCKGMNVIGFVVVALDEAQRRQAALVAQRRCNTIEGTGRGAGRYCG